ncbi:MAG TPA: tRNA lysidine(34) synthetase TilS [Candidatus Sulfotelmatobacter sp.]|nr:tRNA lysidine(34) synthetase TilS [Candidatus Sulfotelmatobacter sp.]
MKRLYHVVVHTLAERVLSHIRQRDLLSAGDRVGVAVSGGIDSVALLRLLLELKPELGIVLAVVHFNHRLRGAESDADQEFVLQLAKDHALEILADVDDVAGHAHEEAISLETAAHDLRYGFFRYLLGEDGTCDSTHRLTKICTGHTLDDQAETVLMRIIRGAGIKGLGGIHPRFLVEGLDGEMSGEIVRPLLGLRRQELECYLRDLGQGWREDSTNTDTSLTRNRVRKLVVPMLEREFNPAVTENLSELAEIARDEEEYWENEVSGWMGTTVQWSEPDWVAEEDASPGLVQIASVPNENPSSSIVDLQARIEAAPWLVMNATLSRVWLLGEPVAVQRRVIRAIADHAGITLEFKHVEEVLRFSIASSDSSKRLSLPSGWEVVRRGEHLVFVTPDLREDKPDSDYEYDLPVPGSVYVHETRSKFEVMLVPAEQQAGYNPEHLLDADSVRGPFSVRNWRPGDRFWPAHTKSPKKIKELLQERHVPQPERRLWPVIVGMGEIYWTRGFPVPAQYRARPGCSALLFNEQIAGQD